MCSMACTEMMASNSLSLPGRASAPSTGLGVGQAMRTRSSYEVLMGEADLVEATIATRIPRLELIAATVDLSGAEIDLIAHERRTHRLIDALLQSSAERRQDVVAWPLRSLAAEI